MRRVKTEVLTRFFVYLSLAVLKLKHYLDFACAALYLCNRHSSGGAL